MGAVALDVGVALMAEKFEAELNGEDFSWKDAFVLAGTTAVSSAVGLALGVGKKQSMKNVAKLVECGMSYAYNYYKEGSFYKAAGETVVDMAFLNGKWRTKLDKKVEIDLEGIIKGSNRLSVARRNFYGKSATLSVDASREVLKTITTKQEKAPAYIKVPNGKLMM